MAYALFGTLVGAALAWLVGRQQHKLALTLEMHREFNSADMLGVRYRAGELLESNHAMDQIGRASCRERV